MAKVESNKVYVKINPEESIEVKKDILESMINSINALIVGKRFNEVRKAEFKLMGRLKNDFKAIHADMDKISGCLPQKAEAAEGKLRRALKRTDKMREKGEWKTPVEEIKIPKNISKNKKYQLELENIKSKLERLG